MWPGRESDSVGAPVLPTLFVACVPMTHPLYDFERQDRRLMLILNRSPYVPQHSIVPDGSRRRGK